MSLTLKAHCLALLAGVFCMAQFCTAQGNSKSSVQLWTSDEFRHQGEELLAQAAKANGTSLAPLMRLPNQYTMLITRTSSGGAELHNRWCDYLVVLDGEGVELTGGSMVDRHDEADGEVRGTRLDGAQSHTLHKGDIIFIPAGTPHQTIEPPGKSITIFVIKAAAPDEKP